MFSDSPLPAADSVLLTTLEETGVRVLRHSVLTEGVGEGDPCDCALQAELAGALLSRNIGLREEDIVMTASVSPTRHSAADRSSDGKYFLLEVRPSFISGKTKCTCGVVNKGVGQCDEAVPIWVT